MSNDAMRDALEVIRDHVTGTDNPLWRTEGHVTVIRRLISELCESALAAPAQSEAIDHMSEALLDANITTRFRRLCKAIGCPDPTNGRDVMAVGILFSAFGAMASMVERAAPAQSEAKPVYLAKESPCSPWEQVSEYIFNQTPVTLRWLLYTAPSAAPSGDGGDALRDRNQSQLIDWLLTDPVTGDRLQFAGPLEPDFRRFSRVQMRSESGAIWTLTARLEEGYLTAAERMANLRRIAKEEAASSLLAARHAPTGADALTDDEIVALAAPYCDDSGWMNGDQIFAFARAVLAKRGGA